MNNINDYHEDADYKSRKGVVKKLSVEIEERI